MIRQSLLCAVASIFFILSCEPLLIGQVSGVKSYLRDHHAIQKIYVHTDRDYYTAGDVIYYKVYVTDASGVLANTAPENVYLDLIDDTGHMVGSHVLLLKDGVANNAMTIDYNLKGGSFLLRAFTDQSMHDEMLVFKKIIAVNGMHPAKNKIVSNDSIFIDFLPEGGKLIDGVSTKMAYRIYDANSHAVETSLEWNDDNGKIELKSNVNGLGSFSISPRVEWKCRIGDSNGRPLGYDIPAVHTTGNVIHANIDLTSMEISVNGNDNFPMILIGHKNGILIQKYTITQNDFLVSLDLKELPQGIIHWTLFDESERPVSERLVFNHFGIDKVLVDTNLENDIYSTNTDIPIELDLYDLDGESVAANLSMSIVNLNAANRISTNLDIKSYMLLESELRAFCKLYFPLLADETDIATVNNIDLVLKVFGWRTFKRKPSSSKFGNGIQLNGRVTSLNNPQKPIRAVGNLTILSEAGIVKKFLTNEEGYFSINGLNFNGSQSVFLQAKRIREKDLEIDFDKIKASNDLSIELFESESSLNSVYDLGILNNVNLSDDVVRYLGSTENPNRFISDAEFVDVDISDVIDLEEVEVKSEKIDPVTEPFESGMLYKRPNSRAVVSEMVAAESYDDIYQMLLAIGFPGLKFIAPEPGTNVKHSIVLRNRGSIMLSNAASFFVNGSFVPQASVENILPREIAFIDVVSSLSKLAAYGELGGNGIIFIYLKSTAGKKSPEELRFNGILNSIVNGYEEDRTFYVPQKEEKYTETSTLFWSPKIRVSDTGTVTIPINSGNRQADFLVNLQGISKDGLPISYENIIRVR